MSLREVLRWARTDPQGAAYSGVIFGAVPTAAAISVVRARHGAGAALDETELCVANTNVSREDLTMWFCQEAMRLTGWLVLGSGPVHVESPGAATYAISLQDS